MCLNLKLLLSLMTLTRANSEIKLSNTAGARAVFSDHAINIDHFRKTFMRDYVTYAGVQYSRTEILQHSPNRLNISMKSNISMTHGNFDETSTEFKLHLDDVSANVTGTWYFRNSRLQDHGTFKAELEGGVLDLVLKKLSPPVSQEISCDGTLKHFVFDMHSHHSWFHSAQERRIKDHIKRHLFITACRKQKRLFIHEILPKLAEGRPKTHQYKYRSLFRFLDDQLVLNYSLLEQPTRNDHYFSVETVGYFHWDGEANDRLGFGISTLPKFTHADESVLPNEPGPSSLFFLSEYLLKSFLYIMHKKEKLQAFIGQDSLRYGNRWLTTVNLFANDCAYGPVCMRHFLSASTLNSLSTGYSLNMLIKSAETPTARIDSEEGNITLSSGVTVRLFAANGQSTQYLGTITCYITFIIHPKAEDGMVTGQIKKVGAAAVESIKDASNRALRLDSMRSKFAAYLCELYLKHKVYEVLNTGLPLPILHGSKWTEAKAFVLPYALSVVAKRAKQSENTVSH